VNEPNNGHLGFGSGAHNDEGPDDGIVDAVNENSVWDNNEYDNGAADDEEPLNIDAPEEVTYDDEGNEDKDGALPESEITLNQDEFEHNFEENGLDDDGHEGIGYGVPIQVAAVSVLADDEMISDTNNQKSKNDTVKETYVDIDEISYEETEGLDSNDSERTLVIDEPLQDPEGDGHEDVLQDEINYEDEDRQDFSIPSGNKIAFTPAPKEQTGKRTRVDAGDSTEGSPKRRVFVTILITAANLAITESKRPRS
jgi:hypothetical protein